MTRTGAEIADHFRKTGWTCFAAGFPAEAASSCFEKPLPRTSNTLRPITVWCEPCVNAGQLEQSIAAALALTALTPMTRWLTPRFPSHYSSAGQVPEAEAAAARARIGMEDPVTVAARQGFLS